MDKQGINTEPTGSAVDEVSQSAVNNAPEDSNASADGGVASNEVSQADKEEQALLAELVGEQTEDVAPEGPDNDQEQPEDAPGSLDPNEEYVFVDKDGNEHRVKGQDVIYLTSQYHRARQELHDAIKAYEGLEQRFEVDKAGLAKDILAQADVTEQLAAAKDILETVGLSDLAQAIDQRMSQYGLEYNPLQPQVELLRRQQEQVRQQQAMMQAQQQLVSEFSNLEKKLGRQLNDAEKQAIDAVYGQYLEAVKVNPSINRPTLEEAYRIALSSLEFEQKRSGAQKPPTRIERPSGPAPVQDLSEDQLYEMLLKSA